MSAPIEISGLRKSFGTTVALDGLDLTVEQGEIHGFLGPNGAGKSTTIRVLLGLLRADGGQARLLGGDPWTDVAQLHRRIAYVPGDVALWPNLTGGEVIDLLARLRGGLNAARRDDLLARFDLDPTKKCRAYSKGNRQKVALVAALSSDAELLLFDEPTAGLDPLMDRVFRDHVDEVRTEGRTVLLSSHILSEVEALCDRVRFAPTVDWANTFSERVTAEQLAFEVGRIGGILLIIGILHGLNIVLMPVLGRLFSLNRRLPRGGAHPEG